MDTTGASTVHTRISNLNFITFRQVFIPELLRYILEFLLDDEDVPIRFVCKLAHDNLSDVSSSINWGGGDEYGQDENDRKRPGPT